MAGKTVNKNPLRKVGDKRIIFSYTPRILINNAQTEIPPPEKRFKNM